MFWNKNKIVKEKTDKQKIGKIGEDYSCEYLKKQSFSILERNYLKKWGEIDIVAKKEGKIHFVEVKSVSRLLGGSVDETDSNVISGTNDSFRAEDNMHPWKLQRLSRAVQSYLLDRDVSDETEWQFDLITVHIDMNKGLHRVFVLEDIVL